MHVASNAAAGGNGTFENPYNELDRCQRRRQPDRRHRLCPFDKRVRRERRILKDNQRLLGEGNNLELTVATQQEGTIVIPESSPGARALAGR